MRSIKAVIVGSLFIVIVGLVIQLAYIFLAVWYSDLAKSYPFLNEIGIYFRFLVGIPVVFLIMFVGGYITADIAKKNVLLHCLIVALLTVGAMTVSALDQAELTFTGFAVFVLALASTVAGGLFWKRGQTQ
jgi:fructose-specific phosphotransferase system IIC component